MSKAEEFIRDYTRYCSNEIWSPYPQINNDVRRVDGESAKEFSPWLTPDQARKAVEIAREEMIGKVCEYIASNMQCDGYTLQTKSKFIKDLKQAIKDE